MSTLSDTQREAIAAVIERTREYSRFTTTDDYVDEIAAIVNPEARAERIAALKREWSAETNDNPDNYVLSQDDWEFGLNPLEAAEIVLLMDINQEEKTR
jgi:hypothetical protein